MKNMNEKKKKDQKINIQLDEKNKKVTFVSSNYAL